MKQGPRWQSEKVVNRTMWGANKKRKKPVIGINKERKKPTQENAETGVNISGKKTHPGTLLSWMGLEHTPYLSNYLNFYFNH